VCDPLSLSFPPLLSSALRLFQVGPSTTETTLRRLRLPKRALGQALGCEQAKRWLRASPRSSLPPYRSSNHLAQQHWLAQQHSTSSQPDSVNTSKGKRLEEQNNEKETKTCSNRAAAASLLSPSSKGRSSNRKISSGALFICCVCLRNRQFSKSY
jgi:hypothetical protein